MVSWTIARQPAELSRILAALRKLVEEAAPDAKSSLKWGMPVFSIGTRMMCALGAHKSHVNLVLVGPPGGFADPQHRLEGNSRGGRHLKLRSLDDLPRESVRRWVRVSAKHARGKARKP